MLSSTQLSCQMEKMQGEGEVDLLEQPGPLTDKEKVMIQESWAKVYENSVDNGVAILLRLFTDFPSSKQFFKDFKHIEGQEELQRSAKFKWHSQRVMKVINTVVENLDDSDKLTSALKTMGRAHALKHNVEPAYFKILCGVILTVLSEAFPTVVTSEVATAWTKLLANLNSTVKAVYEEAGWTLDSTAK